MNLKKTKLFYIYSCIILGVIILLPILFMFIPLPESERFSEIWLLDSNHQVLNELITVSDQSSNTIYIDVANNMGDLEFYKVYVKFRNQEEPLPNRTAGLPSSLSPIFEYHFFLKNNETSENSFIFSFEEISFYDNICEISKLSINGHNVLTNKILVWDEASNGFYCQFFFELWIYNPLRSDFEFNNRSVWFWLNLTNPL